MRILVVEDEERLAQSIKKGLTQESFLVDLALDGEEGLDLALSEEYGVILLDLMLPKITGWEVCRQLREKNISTPVLMLTARGEVRDKVDGLNLGADDYLAKPFDFEELVARINALGRRPKTTLNPVLKVSDIELDMVNCSVKVSSKDVGLSKKEFALLKYFLINKNKLLTKDQIMDNVWDFDADILPNTVEVYMGYLRKKIGSKYFQTKRGFGYKFIDGSV